MKRYTYTIVFSNGVIVRNYTMRKAAGYMECFGGRVTVVKAIPEGATRLERKVAKEDSP